MFLLSFHCGEPDMSIRKRLGYTAALMIAAGPSAAATITLELVDTYDRSAPFGLAWDGSHIWWSDNGRTVHQMTTDGVDTGVTFTGPVWSELAWNGSQLMAANDTTVYFFDRDGGNQTTQSITASPYTGIALNDGLDWDSGELWSSPDVGNVYRLSGDLSSFVGSSPFLGGAGGYSGVERIQATDGTDYVVVVNDASNPRNLCVHNLDSSLIGCQAFGNERYEGLAFDGRYVWAADYFGDKIDKYDILGEGNGGGDGDGCSIINPEDCEPQVVPLPATLPLLLGSLGLGGFLGLRRRHG
jgi:hypothetical protein